MGVLDTVKAFARVGVGKAGTAATGTAAKAVNAAGDVAAKGAASLNKAAEKVRDTAQEQKAESAETTDRPQDDGTTS